MRKPWLLLSMGMALIITACVPARAIRTEAPPAARDPGALVVLPPPHLDSRCVTGSQRPGEQLRVIEDYGDYVIGFAEFDDQGWSYGQDFQLQLIQARLRADLTDPAYAEMDFAVVLFVHGWHHNAHDDDCNVQEMRQMIALSNARFAKAFEAGQLKRRRRLFGIYAGWRGESVDAPGIRYTTIIDRRDVAEKVAKGSIRQLFANIQVQERDARRAAPRSDPVDLADRMFTTVVGHSFGGLVVFNGLSENLLSALTDACSPGPAPVAATPRTVWPDELVLINPAFEASRFETLNRLADAATDCHGLAQPPLVTVVTADNDEWTGPVFTLGRRLLTAFETYDDSTPDARRREQTANIHAIGFVGRYQTHRLCLRESDGRYAAVGFEKPSDTPTAIDMAQRQVWVVGAPKSIIDGHDGFLFVRSAAGDPQPYLLQWLISMHLPGGNAMGSASDCAGSGG